MLTIQSAFGTVRSTRKTLEQNVCLVLQGLSQLVKEKLASSALLRRSEMRWEPNVSVQAGKSPAEMAAKCASLAGSRQWVMLNAHSALEDMLPTAIKHIVSARHLRWF